ncbi:hypothetical protein [Spirillospora sp. NPDC047279]|uniref:hypothetical protein n=1 Tax=Spirillospora sp. NPDC047279 TaxID=3155478 RepID=UPI0033D18401
MAEERGRAGCAIGAGSAGAGLLAAAVAYLGMAVSWAGCGSELEPGGRLFLNLLGLAGLVVMPSVGVVAGGLAALARRSGLPAIVWGGILVAAGCLLVMLVIGWIVVGGPPPGYCPGERP